MTEAVIVSTARTPIAKAFRGAFNATGAPTLAGHVIAGAVARAGLDGGEVDDVILGASFQAGSTGMNIGRMGALAAGLPDTVPGMSIDRQCASGLMAIATAAKQIIVDGQRIVVAGGVEQVSLVQGDALKLAMAHKDATVLARAGDAYMPMLETAEVVARRYGISREAQDAFGLASQRRAAAAAPLGGKPDAAVRLRGGAAHHADMVSRAPSRWGALAQRVFAADDGFGARLPWPLLGTAPLPAVLVELAGDGVDDGLAGQGIHQCGAGEGL